MGATPDCTDGGLLLKQRRVRDCATLAPGRAGWRLTGAAGRHPWRRTEINERRWLINQLEIEHDPAAAKEAPRPVDVVLATNMVSVGVDVPRLGCMVVGGQPKNTAEYIQATSRVGRRSPGLVVTVYNWARPRDLSHYETFAHYHATFYRQVEALSVTPFAPRARDRGLTALFVALVRHARPDWNDNAAAQLVDLSAGEVDRAVEVIRRRAAGVTAAASVASDVAAELGTRRDQWGGEQAIGHRQLVYRRKRGGGTTVGLLKPPSIQAWDEWTCLTSLRDVEPGINLLLAEADLGDATAPGFEPVPGDSHDSDDSDGDGVEDEP